MSETKKYLGSRIQEVRKKYGYKQAQLAEIVGVDSKHMSKIECGYSYPSFDLLDKIARTLCVSPSELLQVEHLNDKEKLIAEIISLLNKAEPDQVRTSYRILTNILH